MTTVAQIISQAQRQTMMSWYIHDFPFLTCENLVLYCVVNVFPVLFHPNSQLPLGLLHGIPHIPATDLLYPLPRFRRILGMDKQVPDSGVRMHGCTNPSLLHYPCYPL